jgi:hypothetical protein
MAITNIENYLKPLTNNERAVLFTAAGLGCYSRFYRVERAQSVEDDLSRYTKKSTKVSDAQVERAIETLLEKGYISMEPKRGNYTFPHNYWKQSTPHNGTMDTKARVFRNKYEHGMHAGVRWATVAEITPVEDVKTAVLKYRERVEREQYEKNVRLGERVGIRQAELEARFLRLCEQYAVMYSYESPIEDTEEGSYFPFSVARIVSEIQQAAKDLDRWTYTRRDIERDAEVARAMIAKEVAA